MTVKELIGELSKYDGDAIVGTINHNMIDTASGVSKIRVEYLEWRDEVAEYFDEKNRVYANSEIIDLVVIN